jgi:hypothetical protein
MSKKINKPVRRKFLKVRESFKLKALKRARP